MTVDELKKHFGVRWDKDLEPIFNVSPATISSWRNKGIEFMRQQAIQTQTNNQLKAREEDCNFCQHIGNTHEN